MMMPARSRLLDSVLSLLPLTCCFCDLLLCAQGPGLACLERMLSGSSRQWPASCDEQPPAAAEAVRQGVGGAAAAADGGGRGSNGSNADDVAADLAAVESGGRPADRDLALGAPAEGGDGDDGKLWFVGDRMSIADIVVADLVSPFHTRHSNSDSNSNARGWGRVG